MEPARFCIGHQNGLVYLSECLGGLETEYDFGAKFVEKSPASVGVDPNSGVPLYPEPVLIFYASVAHRDSAHDRQTLTYGLTRSEYGTQLRSLDDAIPILLKRVLPILESDLRLLKDGKEPRSLMEVRML